MLRKTFALSLLLLFLAAIGKGWYLAKDGFNFIRLHGIIPSGPNGCGRVDLVQVIAEQPFYYLGRGRQCYAFESRDGKYVLKLPRLDCYKLPFWVEMCPSPLFKSYRESKLQEREKRKHFLLNSFHIASKDLANETGTLYYHPYETKNIQRSVTIKDRIGRDYSIDLDKSLFLLQEKTPLLFPELISNLKGGNREKARKILEALVDTVVERAKKGVFTKDQAFLENYGYDGSRALQIDLGCYYYKQMMSREEAFAFSLGETAAEIAQWLKGIDPEIKAWFDKVVEEKRKG